MISYIRHNSVFDLGTRTGVSSCEGLYAELDDIYSKFINPQVRVQYATEDSTTDCLCNMAGKQTLSGGSHAFVFQNGIITVTVGEDDSVTVAEVSSGGGGGVTLIDWGDVNDYSGTVNERPFNSLTDSLRIGDGLYAPYTYWFIDSLDAPFALTGTGSIPSSETTVTSAEYPEYFETTESYQAATTSSDFYLARADKIIKVKKSQSDINILYVFVVGTFEIGLSEES